MTDRTKTIELVARNCRELRHSVMETGYNSLIRELDGLTTDEIKLWNNIVYKDNPNRK